MKKKRFFILIVGGILSLGLMTSFFDAKFLSTQLQANQPPPPSESKQVVGPTTDETHSYVRLAHAKELMGTYYQDSVVNLNRNRVNVSSFVQTAIHRALHKEWKHSSKTISKVILQQSRKYQFDPIFLLAVIENESNFNPEAIGSAGEIGLMQLKPETARWIANKYNLPWNGPESLFDPITNIQIGSAYLSYLREEFKSESQLYIAAYNMGSTNVYRAMGRQILPQTYSRKVMRKYLRFYLQLNEYLST
jgi:soluble lytic murein transglycosylase